MSIDYQCVHWDKGKCEKFSDDKVTSWCVDGACASQTPSNADKIRSMSDEEMAKKLGRGPGCPATADCMKMSWDCEACWLDWLQHPIGGE